MSLIFTLVSCRTPGSLVKKKAAAVNTAEKSYACDKSRGPEVLKNGNFELISSHNISYWRGLDDSNIKMKGKNNLLELDKNQNISQTLNYHSKGYYVKFQYKVEKLQSKLLEVELLGQKIVYSPKIAGKHTFEHIFHGSDNYTLSIKSLTDEKVLIDNISVKPLGPSCSEILQSNSRI